MPIYRIDNNKIIPIERIFFNSEMTLGAPTLKTGFVCIQEG